MPPVQKLPPWAAALLDARGGALADFAGPDRAPDRARVLGGGAMGVVLGTPTPGLVFKLTRDRTEATFVAATLGQDLPGVVPFRAGVALPGRGRPAWALWRGEVYACGRELVGYPRRGPDRDPARVARAAASRVFQYRIEAFRNTAEEAALSAARYLRRGGPEGLAAAVAGARAWVRAARPAWPASLSFGPVSTGWYLLEGLARFGYCLGVCRVIARAIARDGFAPDVGRALGAAMDRGLLLGDVHHGNIGRLGAPDGPWGVFDVGRCRVVAPELLGAALPALGRSAWPGAPARAWHPGPLWAGAPVPVPGPPEAGPPTLAP